MKSSRTVCDYDVLLLVLVMIFSSFSHRVICVDDDLLSLSFFLFLFLFSQVLVFQLDLLHLHLLPLLEQS